MDMKDFRVFASNIKKGIVLSAKDAVALFLGATISAALVYGFALLAGARQAFIESPSWTPFPIWIDLCGMALVFGPMIAFVIAVGGETPQEKPLPFKGKVFALPAVTGVLIFASWIVTGIVTAICEDESFSASLIVSALGAAVVVGYMLITKSKSVLMACSLVVMAGINSAIAYIWAQLLFTPYDMTGTIDDPEAIWAHETNFVFGWPLEALVIALCVVIPLAAWIYRNKK